VKIEIMTTDHRHYRQHRQWWCSNVWASSIYGSKRNSPIRVSFHATIWVLQWRIQRVVGKKLFTPLPPTWITIPNAGIPRVQAPGL